MGFNKVLAFFFVDSNTSYRFQKNSALEVYGFMVRRLSWISRNWMSDGWIKWIVGHLFPLNAV